MTNRTTGLRHSAERLTDQAQDFLIDSRGLPADQAARAQTACRLVAGLAFAQGLLAICDAITDLTRALRPETETETAAENTCAATPADPGAGSPQVLIAAHLQQMADRYPAEVFTEEGHAPDAVAGTALRLVLTREADRLLREVYA